MVCYVPPCLHQEDVVFPHVATKEDMDFRDVYTMVDAVIMGNASPMGDALRMFAPGSMRTFSTYTKDVLFANVHTKQRVVYPHVQTKADALMFTPRSMREPRSGCDEWYNMHHLVIDGWRHVWYPLYLCVEVATIAAVAMACTTGGATHSIQ
eukprot:gene4213-biopygen5248